MRMRRVVLAVLLVAAGLQGLLLAGVQEKINAAKKLAGEQKYEEAIKTYREIIADETATVTQKIDSQDRIGLCCYQGRNYAKAISECKKLIANYPNAPVNILASNQARIASGYYSLNNYEKAISEHRKVMSNYPKASMNTLVWSQMYIGRSYYNWKDYENSLSEYEKLLADYPNVSVGIRAETEMYIGHCCAALGKTPEAIETFLEVLKSNSESQASLTTRGLLRAAASGEEGVDLTSVRQQLQEIVTEKAAFPRTIEPVQALIVELLISEGEFEEALFEAKVFVDVCSPRNLKKASTALSRALKAADGSLVRVNKFFKYQKLGRAGEDKELGTEDDLTDPLADVKDPRAEERDKRFTEGLKKLPRNWQGRILRSRLCRYWGKPRKALKELKIAFALCPAEKKPLQDIANRIVEILVQVSGDPDIGKRFVEFQKHGPDGPDGKPGTKDDLINPVAEYAK